MKVEPALAKALCEAPSSGTDIHDFLFATRVSGSGKRTHPATSRAVRYSRAEADWILHDALKNRGVDLIRRNIICAAARLGGAKGWGKDDSRQKRVTDADEAFLFD